MKGEFYQGICPVGKELVCPQEKLGPSPDEKGKEWAKAPFIICPMHGCKVPMLVVTEQEHAQVWGRWPAAA